MVLVQSLVSCAKDAKDQIPGLTYSDEPATLVLQVKHLSQDVGNGLVTLVYVPGLAQQETVDTLTLGEDAMCTHEVSLVYTKKVMLNVMGHYAEFLMTPGKETKVTVDQKLLEATDSKKPAWTFKGDNADLNEGLANYGNEYDAMRLTSDINGQGLKNLEGMDVAGFKQMILGKYENGLKVLEEDKRLKPAFREYVKTEYQIHTMAYMTGYAQILAAANNKQMEDYTAPEDYWDEVKQWAPMGSNAALYGRYGESLAVCAQMFGQYTGSQNTSAPESYTQLGKAQKYATAISDFQPLTPEEKENIKRDCPQFEMTLLDMNAEMVAKVEENKKKGGFKVMEFDESLKGEDVFKALIAPYKGKPLLVDFWATWCGPCKAAMKTILPVKEKLMGQVNFIYITGPSSPKATWSNMIPDIHGDHYYVTKEQWNTLLDQFESQGIPTYVIVDKDGNVVTKHIGYPGNEVIEEELMK